MTGNPTSTPAAGTTFRAVRSVLLVEDNPGDAFLVGALLRESGAAGIEITTAATLEEAARLLRGEPFDAVLLDLNLPDSGGLATLRDVRVAAPGTPVVVMSGHDDEDLAIMAVHEGAQDYLVKGRADGDLIARSLHYAAERARTAASLAERNRELEERNAEAEAFIYTVSHDLRQPLIAIQGMSDLLWEAVQASLAGAASEAGRLEEISFLAGRISRNADRMGNLLNDLLQLSRVGRAVDPAEDLDMGEVAAAALADLSERVRARGMLLELPAEWPRVRCPRSEAYQVLLNLLGNAVKFAGRPGERPHVRVTCSDRDGEALLVVEDNGPGVPVEQREKVFRLFAKLDASAEGTGVGLAIVKRAVERYGGSVLIDASEIGGARVTARLPLAP